nr:hypothetical protein [Paraflavitalea speifideiaquila]
MIYWYYTRTTKQQGAVVVSSVAF